MTQAGRDGIETRATRYAALLAGNYAVFAAVYILLSTALAARLAGSVNNLREIELIKGLAFVLVTAVAVFVGARVALARLERSAAEVSARDRALVSNERRVLAGVLAGSIAHDINNVLTAVLVDVEDLSAAPGVDPAPVERLRLATDRLVGLNARLLQLASHATPGAAADVDLATMVREVLETLRSHPSVRRCDVQLDAPEPVVVRGHPILIQQIVANLVLNAGEATGGRGRVAVRVARDGDHSLLEVCDNGPGVPAERRAGIFDAMRSTKPGGGGLGLFSVQSCAHTLGGEVEVGDAPLGGACFRVRLPAAAPAAR